jgi:hypothetical protein
MDRIRWGSKKGPSVIFKAYDLSTILQLCKKEKKAQQRFSSNPAEAEQSASSMMSREMLCMFPPIADGLE